MSGQEGWYALQNVSHPNDSLPVFKISDFHRRLPNVRMANLSEFEMTYLPRSTRPQVLPHIIYNIRFIALLYPNSMINLSSDSCV